MGFQIYKIKKGDTLTTIALKHGCTVDAIMRLNPQIIDRNKIYVDSTIKIPSQPSSFDNNPQFNTYDFTKILIDNTKNYNWQPKSFNINSLLNSFNTNKNYVGNITNSLGKTNSIISNKPSVTSTLKNGQFRNEFLNAMKKVEDEPLMSKENTYRLAAQKSVEGGTDTIGFGHKLQLNEYHYLKTKSDADTQLLKDLSIAEKNAKEVYEKKKYNWNSLNQTGKEMLTEKAFNVGKEGLASFPKMMEALSKNNYNTAIKESKTYYTHPKTKEKIELTRRWEILKKHWENN